MHTENDYRVLKNISDKEDKEKGFSKLNATSRQEIVAKTGLSYKKVSDAIASFLEEGLIDYGIARGKTKTYHLTIKGLEELNSLKVNIKEELQDE